MGYNLHITRADSWIDSEYFPIELEELKDYFSKKRDFEYTNMLTSSGGPASISIGGDFFIWNGFDYKVTFMYKDGRLVVSVHDEEVIDTLKEIALDFGALVVGDEGEVY